jgi:hypothetical protein
MKNSTHAAVLIIAALSILLGFSIGQAHRQHRALERARVVKPNENLIRLEFQFNKRKGCDSRKWLDRRERIEMMRRDINLQLRELNECYPNGAFPRVNREEMLDHAPIKPSQTEFRYVPR